MKLWERLLGVDAEARHSVTSIDDYFLYAGSQYPIGLQTSMSNLKEEPTPTGFESYATRVFKSHPVVYRAQGFRKAVFSQARYKWRNLQTGALFGSPTLAPLERPWPGGTTSSLNARMLLHGDLAGNAYVHSPKPGRLALMRPDWCTIVLGSDLDPDSPALAEDAEFVGVMYKPPRAKGRFYFADQVAHFAPMPDPTAHYRGMSWLTPIIRELQADNHATEHKMLYFKQGATPNFAIVFDKEVEKERLLAFKEIIESEHGGLANAYKTLYLGGGADPKPLGTTVKDMDFASLQGKAETRILMAAGVHPVLAGASEGMQGASLNAGNFKQVRRNFSDIDLQDLFLEASASLEVLLTPPRGVNAELAVDPRNIPFLQDDQLDQAQIQREQASAITIYVRDGFTPESAVQAVVTNDPTALVHTDLLSVQLQDPEASGGDDEASDSGLDDEAIAMRINSAATLIRSGFVPAAALEAVGLDPIDHFDLLPVTLQSPKVVEAQAQAAEESIDEGPEGDQEVSE